MFQEKLTELEHISTLQKILGMSHIIFQKSQELATKFWDNLYKYMHMVLAQTKFISVVTPLPIYNT